MNVSLVSSGTYLQTCLFYDLTQQNVRSLLQLPP